MKIKVTSDLHFEFHRDGGSSLIKEIMNSNPDMLIIAGDLTDSNGLENSYNLLNSIGIPVISVFGNHEFYNSSPKEIEIKRIKLQEKFKNIHILNRERKIINNIPFCGATLWFQQPKMKSLQDYMIDFKKIKDFTPWVYEEAQKDKEFFEREIKPNDIVISHHLPSYASVSEIYIDSPLNAFFVHDVTSIVENKKASWWVHGHTHESCYYQMGSTNVIANPFGYSGYGINRNWNSDFKITYHV